MSKPEITVVIASYRPVWEKMRMTLRSILLQQGIHVHIVVTDDGSEENYFDRIEQYLAEQGAEPAVLVAAPENRGTVENSLQGLSKCQTEYVKGISPGDMLYGEHVLADWYAAAKAKDATVSFCDAIYYHMEDDQFVATAEKAHPQVTAAYPAGKAMIAPNYILFGDIALGAALMTKAQVQLRYLEKMQGKVIYAEDNVFRLMAWCGETFHYYPHDGVLYEYGTGISTSGSDIWQKRIQKDWQASNAIIHTLPPADPAWEDAFAVMGAEGHGLGHKVRKVLSIPGFLHWRLACKLHPRWTRTGMDTAYLEKLRK